MQADFGRLMGRKEPLFADKAFGGRQIPDVKSGSLDSSIVPSWMRELEFSTDQNGKHTYYKGYINNEEEAR